MSALMQKSLSKSQSTTIPRSTLVRNSNKKSGMEEMYSNGGEENKSRFKEEKPFSKSIHDLMQEEEDLKKKNIALDNEII
jgi:hypothetical protein